MMEEETYNQFYLSSSCGDQTSSIQADALSVILHSAQTEASPSSSNTNIERQRDKLRDAIRSWRSSISDDTGISEGLKKNPERPFSDITLDNANRSGRSVASTISSLFVYADGSNQPSTTKSSKKKLQKRSRESISISNNGLNCGTTTEKPGWSYPYMVALAMFHSKRGCLTVSEIYSFIEEHFPYFRTAPACWKNSVRHNLSLNKCFEKCEESANGRGLLWRIVEDKKEKLQTDILKWKERHSERNNLGSVTQRDLCEVLKTAETSTTSSSSMSDNWVQPGEMEHTDDSAISSNYLYDTSTFDTDCFFTKKSDSDTVQFSTPVKCSSATPLVSPGNMTLSPSTDRYQQCSGVYDSVCHALDENSLMFDAFQ